MLFLALALLPMPVLGAPYVGAVPWAVDADARVVAENTLVFDRWRGTRSDPVERVGVRQRLFLQWFAHRPEKRHHVGVDVVLDLVVDMDLGPGVLANERQPTSRRPALDPRRAGVRVDRIYGVLDLDLGRHLVIDALGFETYDGLSAELRPPLVAIGGSVGLGVAPGWNEFGPDIFAPDGSVYDDAPALVFGGRAEARGVSWLDAGLAIRQRRSEAAIQRSEAGYSARLHAGGLALSSRGRADLVYLRFADIGAALEYRGVLGARLGWNRHWPTFRADSIWNVFGAEPFHAFDAGVDYAFGDWVITIDGERRVFDPGATADGDFTDVSPIEDSTSHEGGARLTRAYGLPGRRGEVGVEGRWAEGYGGARRYGDIFARAPLPLWRPMDLKARLGAVSVASARDGDPVTSGWGLFGMDWAIAPTIRIEAVTEVYVSEHTPFRMRALTNLRFEDWW